MSKDKDIKNIENKEIAQQEPKDRFQRPASESVRVSKRERDECVLTKGPLYVSKEYENLDMYRLWVNDTPGNIDTYIQVLKFSYVLDKETGLPKTAPISGKDCSQAFLLELPRAEYELREAEDREEVLRKRALKVNPDGIDMINEKLEKEKNYKL